RHHLTRAHDDRREQGPGANLRADDQAAAPEGQRDPRRRPAKRLHPEDQLDGRGRHEAPDLGLRRRHARLLDPRQAPEPDNVDHDRYRQFPRPTSEEAAWPVRRRSLDPQDHPTPILSDPEKEPNQNGVVGRKVGERRLANLFRRWTTTTSRGPWT